MILRFRTKRDANGNYKYLAFDTGAECYATEPHGWMSSDIPEVKLKDLRELREKCELHEYKRVGNM